MTMPPSEPCMLLSFTRSFPDVSFVTFLEAMPIAPRIYWESGQVTTEFAGGGAAAEVYVSPHELDSEHDRFEVVRQKLAALFSGLSIDSTAPDSLTPRVFGGFAFRDDFVPADVWTAFPTAYFVLPRYQISRTHSDSGFQTWLTINRQLMPFEHVDSALDSLEWEFDSVLRRVMMYAEQQANERKTAHIEALDYPLDRGTWQRMIDDATARMKAHEFEKVVLARTADVSLSAPANLLAALERMGLKYPHTFRFLIEPGAGRAFFGASPELLAHVHSGMLDTAALAGSRSRGRTEADDAALAHDLMTSAKDRAEHQFVVDFLRERLAPYTRDLEAAQEPSLLKLSNIQHLHTPMRAALNADADVLTLTQALHPTPALGGTPQSIGMATIARLEPITRGWYAGPVGWIDSRGDGMFAVAIRSAVNSGKRVRLYAGAGIVADSDPDKEWDEIEWKFKPMLDALGAETYARA
ncbi:MAG: isochorismate synthase [Anaerolineae bacterium]